MSSSSPHVVTAIALTNIGYKSNVSKVSITVFCVSHDFHHQFDTLLANIPALSVGLLGFAVLTFFMILKKVKLSVFQEIHEDMRTHFCCFIQSVLSPSLFCSLHVFCGDSRPHAGFPSARQLYFCPAGGGQRYQCFERSSRGFIQHCIWSTFPLFLGFRFSGPALRAGLGLFVTYA